MKEKKIKNVDLNSEGCEDLNLRQEHSRECDVHCHKEERAHNHEEEEHDCHNHSHSHSREDECCGHSHSHTGECACGHHHGHGEHGHGCACCDDTPVKIDKDQKVWKVDKKQLVLVILSAVLLVAAFCMEHFGGEKLFWGYLPVYIVAYLLVAIESFAEGFRGLKEKDFFNENTLMNVASIGAFCIGEFEEGVAVMLLYTIGEIIQGISVRKSKKSIGQLLDIRVDKSLRIESDGSEKLVDTAVLAVGDRVIVNVGEKVPVDGKIVQGQSSFDYSKLTGESMPVELKTGEEILAGTLNLESSVIIEVSKGYNDSTVSKILRLVEEAQQNKPSAEKFVRKFARIYTPAVFAVALIIAVFAPMIKAFGMTYTESIAKGLVFLVISCPCALVISTPLTYFGGIGSASRRGILVKGGNYLEILNNIDEICFDKTGTITEGKLKVASIEAEDRQKIIQVAGACEKLSNHPIADCISEYCAVKDRADSGKEIAGKGLVCEYKGKVALLGNIKLMRDYGIEVVEKQDGLTRVYVAYDGSYLGDITLEDSVREGVSETIDGLKQRGIRAVMLTGDNETVANKVASKVGIDEYKAGLLPQDKCDYVKACVEEGKKVMFVGDGLNDAPAIKSATIGVCIGGMGNDASVEASDVVLVGGKLTQLDDAFKVAKKTKKIIIQNIVMALGLKFAIMIICLFVSPLMWLAVVADVGVCLLAIFNSMRTLRIKGDKRREKAKV